MKKVNGSMGLDFSDPEVTNLDKISNKTEKLLLPP